MRVSTEETLQITVGLGGALGNETVPGHSAESSKYLNVPYHASSLLRISISLLVSSGFTAVDAVNALPRNEYQC